MFRYPTLASVLEMGVSHHVVVDASAGTGKTYLLERRVADLVIKGAATIDQILLVTFTEKATAELRRRIRGFLLDIAKTKTLIAGPARDSEAEENEPHWLLGEEEYRRVDAAIANFDKSAISTIHSFCQRLARETAFAANRLLEQTQAPEEQIFHDAFYQTLREEIATDDSGRELLLTWLTATKSRKNKPKTVADLEDLLLNVARKEGATLPPYNRDRLFNALLSLATLLQAGPVDVLLQQFDIKTVTAKACKARLETAQAALETLTAKTGDGALTTIAGSIDTKFVRDRLPANSDLYKALFAVEAENPGLATVMVENVLPKIQQRLEKLKSDTGVFDFGDMLTLAWRAISGTNGKELVNSLRRNYPYALIDEFQDTDPVQWKIFREVYLESLESKLTVVGDPKQAIYGFRGADFQTYIAAKRQLLEMNAVEITLEKNFRSTPEMVDALNTLFKDDGAQSKDQGFFGYGTGYQKVSSGSDRRLEQAGKAISIVEISDANKIGAFKEQLRSQFSTEIKKLVNGPAQITTGEKQSSLTFSDIFVLTRSRNEAQELAETFRDEELPCSMVQDEKLFESVEFADWVDLLSAIAAPSDRSLRLRAWLTGFFDIPFSELGMIGQITDDHPLASCFFRWNRQGKKNQFPAMFNDILHSTLVRERRSFTDLNKRSIINYEHIYELLVEFTQGGQVELGDLPGRVAQWEKGAADQDFADKNLQRKGADENAIQIMTMHKSKGLEAPVVFLYGGFTAVRSRSLSVTTFDSAAGSGLRIGGPRNESEAAAMRAEEKSESARLMYVAATRAIGKLYLPFGPGGAPKIGGAYHVLHERIPGLQEPENLAIAETLVGPVKDATATTSISASPTHELLSSFMPSLEFFEQVPPKINLPRGRPQTSYSRLARNEETVLEAESEIVHLGSPPALPDSLSEHHEKDGKPALPRGKTTGIFLHELLERIPLPAVDQSIESFSEDPQVQGFVAKTIARFGFPRDFADRTIQLLYENLIRKFIPSSTGEKALSACSQISREVEFLYPGSSTRHEDSFVTGFWDAVLENENRYFVIDWKSDTLPAYGSAEVYDYSLEKYKIQIEIYSTALRCFLQKYFGEHWRDHYGGLIYVYLRGPQSCHFPQLPDVGNFS